MVDSMDTYKSISIGILVLEHSEMMKNPEILKFVPDHLKTKKKKCEHGVKKLTYLLIYVPDQYITQQMCDKAILENNGKCVIKQF